MRNPIAQRSLLLNGAQSCDILLHVNDPRSVLQLARSVLDGQVEQLFPEILFFVLELLV
jgi:hypothetical protein